MTRWTKLSVLVGALFISASISAQVVNVTGVSPARESLQNPTTTTIAIDFDAPVDPASITSNSFWAFGRWSGPVEGTFEFTNGNQTVTLVPTFPLSAGESVMVILSHDIVGMGGGNLRQAGYSYNFWVEALPSTLVFEEIDVFSTRTDPFQTTRSYGGVGSDLNNDGFLDLAIVNEDTADLRIYLNLADGTGLFGPMEDPPTPINFQASPNEPSDFNRDGNVDIVVSNAAGGSLSILLGNGDGSFQPQQEILVGGSNHGVAVLDVDGDGDIDIVNANTSPGNISLLLNDGNGVFGAPTFFDGGVFGEWPVSAADFNGDGILDFAVGGIDSNSVAVHLCNGDGTFTLGSVTGGLGATWMFAVADLNGDGNADLSSANSFSNQGSISLGDGAGGFSSTTQYTVDSFPLATDHGDLDGDGDLDWVLSSFNGDWTMLENDGNGVFTIDQEFPATAAASCAILLDFDNDGDLDAALIDELDDTVTLMRQTGPIGPPAPQFVRGDCNIDGSSNIGDVIFGLTTLFSGMPPCDDACDNNDDGNLDIADPIFLLNFLFDGGPNAPPPSPDCGVDGTADSLNCDAFSICP